VLLIHGPVMEAGGFPWGLLIIAGLVYLIWSKNSGRPWGRGFDNSRGFGNSQMHSGPQALFDQWHREAHQAAQPQTAQPQAAQPQASQPYAAQPQAPAAPAAAPTPAGADVPGTPPAPQPPQSPMAGSSGPELERW
jgi:hypothetical protein